MPSEDMKRYVTGTIHCRACLTAGKTDQLGAGITRTGTRLWCERCHEVIADLEFDHLSVRGRMFGPIAALREAAPPPLAPTFVFDGTFGREVVVTPAVAASPAQEPVAPLPEPVATTDGPEPAPLGPGLREKAELEAIEQGLCAAQAALGAVAHLGGVVVLFRWAWEDASASWSTIRRLYDRVLSRRPEGMSDRQEAEQRALVAALARYAFACETGCRLALEGLKTLGHTDVDGKLKG